MEYQIRENSNSWTVTSTVGKVEVSFNISKTDAPTLTALKEYVKINRLFGENKND